VEAEVVAAGERRSEPAAAPAPLPRPILGPARGRVSPPELAEAAPAPAESPEAPAQAVEREEVEAAEASVGPEPVEDLPPEPVETAPAEPLLAAAPVLDEEEAEDDAEAVPPDAVETSAPAESVPAEAPSLSTAEWSCEIALWPDGDEAVFYARSFHRGDEIVVAESPRFAIGGDAAIEAGGAVLEAHAALTNELVQAGWTRVGPGPEWYADRFRRNFDPGAVTASLTTRVLFARRS